MQDKDIEEIKKEFDIIVNLLIDWNYGTIYKQYDREETTEVLAEDTLKYTNDLWELVKPHFQPRNEVIEKVITDFAIWLDANEQEVTTRKNVKNPSEAFNRNRLRAKTYLALKTNDSGEGNPGA